MRTGSGGTRTGRHCPPSLSARRRPRRSPPAIRFTRTCWKPSPARPRHSPISSAYAACCGCWRARSRSSGSSGPPTPPPFICITSIPATNRSARRSSPAWGRARSCPPSPTTSRPARVRSERWRRRSTPRTTPGCRPAQPTWRGPYSRTRWRSTNPSRAWRPISCATLCWGRPPTSPSSRRHARGSSRNQRISTIVRERRCASLPRPI